MSPMGIARVTYGRPWNTSETIIDSVCAIAYPVQGDPYPVSFDVGLLEQEWVEEHTDGRTVYAAGDPGNELTNAVSHTDVEVLAEELAEATRLSTEEAYARLLTHEYGAPSHIAAGIMGIEERTFKETLRRANTEVETAERTASLFGTGD